jgi:hypothetical protein
MLLILQPYIGLDPCYSKSFVVGDSCEVACERVLVVFEVGCLFVVRAIFCLNIKYL